MEDINRMSLTRFVLCSCLFVLLMGCGGESSSTISGKISHDGKDLNSGTILFQAASGEVESTKIQSDGTYTVTGLPKGSAKISVSVTPYAAGPAASGPAGAMSADEGAEEAVEKNPVLIPRKYDNVEKSGLTVELAGGAQTHDIVLE